MQPSDYLRVLRNWRGVIVATIVAGVLLAVATTPRGGAQYEATHTLALVDASGDAGFGVQRLAFLVTHGAVPELVAEDLDEPKDSVVDQVEVFADDEISTIHITGTAQTSGRAARVADAFAEALKASLAARDEAQNQELEREADALLGDIRELDARIARGETGLEAAREDLAAQYEAIRAVQQEGNQPVLESVEEADPSRIGGPLPLSRRLAIAGFVGLLIGVGLALTLAHFDTRLRTKEAAESAYGVPVLAEVPLLGRRGRRARAIVTLTDPFSLAAESYRGLRTSLLLGRAAHPGPGTSRRRGRTRGSDQPGEVPSRGSRVLLVTSATAEEGKTTTAANLATVFAEAGDGVVVVNCDLRRPALHEVFGLSEEPGLSNVLHGDAGVGLPDAIRPTSVPGVRVMTSGHPVANPGELLARGAEFVAAVREFADVVIIDTAPVLAASDVSALIPFVDDVLLVCRMDRTTAESARRTIELLGRLAAPVRGVTLIGSTVPAARSYYSDYARRQRGRRARDSAGASAPLDDGRAHGAPDVVGEPTPNGAGEQETADETSKTG